MWSGSLPARFFTIADALRTNYWLVPVVMSVSAAALAIMAVLLEQGADRALSRDLGIPARSPEGARAVLSVIATAMVTAVSITFSITIVVLTLASQQFGPHLVRNFMRDRGYQFALGAFLAAFTYSIVVLPAVGSSAGPGAVPSLALSIAVGLALLSVGVFIFFIQHISSTIRPAHIVRVAGAELETAIDRVFPGGVGTAAPDQAAAEAVAEQIRSTGTVLYARRSGYLQAVDGAALLAAAERAGTVLLLLCRPGDYIVAGLPTARVRCDVDAAFAAAVNEALIVGDERTHVQDLELSIEQLVEVAVRALSRSVNDPFTAINCIDRLSSSFCRLATTPFPSPFRCSADGALRLVVRPWSFRGALEAAFDPIRQYGRDSVSVTVRLLEALHRISQCAVSREHAAAIAREALIIRRGSESLPSPEDRGSVEERYARLRRVLESRGLRDPPPG